MRFVKFYDTKMGKLGIVEEDNAITMVTSFREIENAQEKETELIKKTYAQLCEYFEGKRKTFDLPTNPQGSEFQKKVWNALCEIPYGKTATYKEIARAIGDEKASRAIGMANNKNPLMIIVPCHRVIGTNGTLVGYAGGLDMKTNLLKLEGAL